MLKVRVFLTVLTVCLVAGCASKPNGPADPETSTGPDVPSMSFLAGLNCKEGGASALGVAGTYGEKAPPGWEAPPTEDPATDLTIQVLQCERIEWGPLERPAHLLWEHHLSFYAPDSCREDGTINSYLGTVWSDDPVIVEEALKMGMPAILGTFNLDVTSNQDVEVWTWNWRVEGGETSSFTVSDNPPAVPVTFTSPSRFFWFSDNRVNFYENTFVEVGRNQVGNPTAVGTMAAPMLYAQGGVPAFFGTAALARDVSFQGAIHRFGDLECKNELPFS